MEFTYEAYTSLLDHLRRRGYCFKNYHNWEEEEQTVILRHDVDNSLQKAVRMSEIERPLLGNEGATYFVLLSTDFYNVYSVKSREYMKQIMKNGGIIGLHFDETQYEAENEEELKRYIIKEAAVLSDVIERKVDVVSMHRPSEKILSARIELPDMINSYGEIYFKQMKYLSDSRRHWREDVDGIIEEKAHERLHILTHPFWYMPGREKSLKETLQEAVMGSALQYYDSLKENFRDLETELKRTEIEERVKK